MRGIRRVVLAGVLVLVLLFSTVSRASAAAWQSFMWRSTNSGSTWSQPDIEGSVGGWVSMAASSDGTKVIAGQFNQFNQDLAGSNVYRSTDSGATWTKITALGDGIWFGLASSADGTKLAAADASGGKVYLSTDSGATWVEQTNLGLGSWTSLAMSSDGSRIFAGQGSFQSNNNNSGKAYLSTDSGATWVEQTDLGLGNWWSASMSTNGAIVVATDVSTGKIYKYDANALFDAGYHIQSGMTWIDITDVQMTYVYNVRVSGDGSTIVLTEGVYNASNSAWLSVDSGAHWSKLSSEDLPDTSYASISLSSDGHTIMLGGYGFMYVSSNQGQTWDPIVELGDLSVSGQDGFGGFWYSSVMSADGTTRYVSQYNFNPDDADGIAHEVEDAAPNNGDANNDGTADSGQDNVASFMNPVTNHYTSLAVDDSCSITQVSAASESDNATQDANHSYPLGLLNFSLNCGTNGYEATVTQYFYGSDVNIANLSLRKYNPSTRQYQDVPSASISRQTIDGESVVVVSYTVTDGGALDADGEANGTIVDPSGLVLTDATETVKTTDTLASTGQSTQIIIATSLAMMLFGSTVALTRRRQF